MRARNDTAAVDVPRTSGIELAATVVVGHFDQLYRLVFLKTFCDCAFSAANVMAPTTDLGDDPGLPMDVARTNTAHLLRTAMQAPLAEDQKSTDYQQQRQRGVRNFACHHSSLMLHCAC